MMYIHSSGIDTYRVGNLQRNIALRLFYLGVIPYILLTIFYHRPLFHGIRPYYGGQHSDM